MVPRTFMSTTYPMIRRCCYICIIHHMFRSYYAHSCNVYCIYIHVPGHQRSSLLLLLLHFAVDGAHDQKQCSTSSWKLQRCRYREELEHDRVRDFELSLTFWWCIVYYAQVCYLRMCVSLYVCVHVHLSLSVWVVREVRESILNVFVVAMTTRISYYYT